MLRAVVDTNLLVSYLISHRPPISELIDVHLAQNDWVLLTAPVLLQELARVLQYPRLHRYYTAVARARFVAVVTALSEQVELPDTAPRICRDPDDDWVIACAVIGRADVIVSGDRDLLDLTGWRYPHSLCPAVPVTPAGPATRSSRTRVGLELKCPL